MVCFYSFKRCSASFYLTYLLANYFSYSYFYYFCPLQVKTYHLYNIRLFIVYYSQQWDLYFVFLLISSLLFHLKEVSLTFLLEPVCAVLCLVIQLCVTLCNLKDCSLPGTSVFEDSPGKNTEWVAMPSSSESSQPRSLQPRIEPRSSTLQAASLPSEPSGKPKNTGWVAYPFSRGSSQPKNQTRVSCIADRFFTSWATREAQGQSSCYAILQCFLMCKTLYLLQSWRIVVDSFCFGLVWFGFFSTLNISLHSFWACTVSAEKYAHGRMEVTLCLTLFFSCCF